jgi:hypothetical protein
MHQKVALGCIENSFTAIHLWEKGGILGILGIVVLFEKYAYSNIPNIPNLPPKLPRWIWKGVVPAGKDRPEQVALKGKQQPMLTSTAHCHPPVAP